MSAPSPLSDGNRKDPRARVLNMTVRYRSATVDEFIENHSHDISRGGMFIKTKSPFPAGTLLKFEVRIAEDQKLMHGVGRVVWRREPTEETSDPPAGMGIKFIKTGEGAASLIGQLVSARKGEESNFDAGVRDDRDDAQPIRPGSSPSVEAVRPTPSPATDSSRATQPPPSDFESMDFDPSAGEAEILVSSPPKARTNHTPEKRKVVLKDAPAETQTDSEPAEIPLDSGKRSSEPPATLPPRAQRAPESAHGAAVSPEVARAALAAAEEPKKGPGLGSFVALVAAAAGAWLLLNPGQGEETAPTRAENAPPPQASTPPAVARDQTKALAREPKVSRSTPVSPTGFASAPSADTLKPAKSSAAPSSPATPETKVRETGATSLPAAAAPPAVPKVKTKPKAVKAPSPKKPKKPVVTKQSVAAKPSKTTTRPKTVLPPTRPKVTAVAKPTAPKPVVAPVDKPTPAPVAKTATPKPATSTPAPVKPKTPVVAKVDPKKEEPSAPKKSPAAANAPPAASKPSPAAPAAPAPEEDNPY